MTDLQFWPLVREVLSLSALHSRSRFLKLLLLCWITTASSLCAISVSDYAVQITAGVEASPARITLTWAADPDATGYTVYRRTFPSPTESWGGSVQSLPGNATTFVDSSVTLGQRYEYRVVRAADENGTAYTGYGFVATGIEAPLVESRGTVILVVDNTHSVPLAAELERLERDLAGDGWSVIRHDVARTASVSSIKTLIVSDYLADPSGVKSVFLFGHVPVPYSGNINPDGHPEHRGAWPADLYYGDMDGTFSDASVNTTSAARDENDNVPGDSKFDQSTVPTVGLTARIELQVGRVDLANMPAFAPSTEAELLRNYLNKDHAYRHKQLTAPARGLVDDHFGVFSGEAFAVNGWRNFVPLLGQGSVANLDWVSTLTNQSYLWAYGTGPGSYTSASGVATTEDFAANNLRAIFTMLFGSYHGDWDVTNSFLRAPLAGGTHGLACSWTGRPHWYFHGMGMGETLGFAAQATQNNGGTTYPSNFGARSVHIALMGDPTLRMYVVAPPTGVEGELIDENLELTWTPSTDLVAGYHIYEAVSAAGPFSRLTPAPVAGNTYSIAGGGLGKTYMVRAVRLEITPSGTFHNQSQGAFYTYGELRVQMTNPQQGAILPLAPVTLEATASDEDSIIAKVEFLHGDTVIGEDDTPPYQFTWQTPAAGPLILSARATNAEDQTRDSQPASVFVGAYLPPEKMNFEMLFVAPDATQDGQSGTPTLAEVLDDGATLRLNGNCWKRITLAAPYNITPNSILQFDFRSTAQGEYHGIALDEDTNSGNANRLFQLYGTQTSGIQNYRSYPGDGTWHTYTIPVSLYYTGPMRYVVFTLDHDAATSINSSNGSFRNVRLFEKPTINITASDPTAAELNADGGSFTLTRSGSTAATFEVDLILTGTATNGEDYAAIPSTITFPAGQASVAIPVTPITDTLAEGTEIVACSIAPSPTYVVGTGSPSAVEILDLPLDSWRNEFFSPGELNDLLISGMQADPDNDGIPNLLEYAFFLLPRTPDPGQLPQPVLRPVGTPDHLEITFRRRREPSDIQYVVEVTSDPGSPSWQSGPAHTEIVSTVDLGGGIEEVTIRDLATQTSATKRFMRLRVVH